MLAITADLLQIVLFPVFIEGFSSPLADALDVVVCLTLTLLVGWHFAFLPSFVAKGIPVVDIAPSWTLAVFIATRQKRKPETRLLPPPDRGASR